MNGALNPLEKFITGVIAIGVVTAFAINGPGLAKVVGSAGTAGSQLMSTTEKG